MRTGYEMPVGTRRGREYVRPFEGPIPLLPSKHVAVVACLDARLDVYRYSGSLTAKRMSSATPVGW